MSALRLSRMRPHQAGVLAGVFLSVQSSSASPPLKLGVPLSPPAGAVTESTNPRAEEVEVGGTRLYKVTQGSVVLYLPRLERLTPAEFERAMCAPAGHSTIANERLVGKVEARVTRELSAYAGLINSTHQRKCVHTGGESSASLSSPDARGSTLQIIPEAGFSYKPDANDTKEYKVFIRPGAALGAGMNF